MEELIILTVSTEKNRNLYEWEKSLNGYKDYKILGEGVKWEGFNTKMKLIIDELRNYSLNQIVLVTDCYDLVFVDDPKLIIQKYQKIANGKILMGTEHPCSVNCINKHIKKCNLVGEQLHVNGGFVMGPAKLLTEAYEYCLLYGNEDDQIGFSKYFSENCDKFILDMDSEIVLNYNRTHLLYPKNPKLEIDNNGKFKITGTNTYPLVIHMPYQMADMGKRSEFVRSSIFPDRESISNKEYFNEWIKHVNKSLKYPIYQGYLALGIIVIILIFIGIFSVIWYKYKK